MIKGHSDRESDFNEVFRGHMHSETSSIINPLNVNNTNQLHNDVKKPMETFEITDPTMPESVSDFILPNMWSWDYVGLYCQYAAVGLLYGI
jgi:hypothetical protein